MKKSITFTHFGEPLSLRNNFYEILRYNFDTWREFSYEDQEEMDRAEKLISLISR